jgi:hypothetical protein
MKAYGEETGSSGIEGRAKQTAKEIADVLKKRFQEQGWIQSSSPYKVSIYRHYRAADRTRRPLVRHWMRC